MEFDLPLPRPNDTRVGVYTIFQQEHADQIRHAEAQSDSFRQSVYALYSLTMELASRGFQEVTPDQAAANVVPKVDNSSRAQAYQAASDIPSDQAMANVVPNLSASSYR